jgi:hypothetical protein
MTSHDYRDTVAALETDLAALKAVGGDHFDVVQFRFIESMTEKAGKRSEPVANIVATRALAALTAYQSALERERKSVNTMIAEIGARHPAAVPELQALLDTHKFAAAKKLASRVDRRAAKTPLADLLEGLESRSQTADKTSPRGPMSANLQEQENTLIAADSCKPAALPAAELSAAQYFRELRQQRAAQDRVSRALQEAPEDSGPLNPQKLVIRSMLAMRDLSPCYLARFVSYVDTLFWLETMGSHKK